MTFGHTVTVRYGECDMQGVVFNAHYLAYADDAVAQWFAAAMPGAMFVSGHQEASFDFMVKKAVVTWAAGSTFGDRIDLACSVGRWGRSSFDVLVAGTVAGAERFDVVLTYVSVTPGTHRPCAVPDDVRAALQPA